MPTARGRTRIGACATEWDADAMEKNDVSLTANVIRVSARCWQETQEKRHAQMYLF